MKKLTCIILSMCVLGCAQVMAMYGIGGAHMRTPPLMLAYFLGPLFVPQYVTAGFKSAGGGGTAPSGFSATGSQVSLTGGNKYNFPTFTVTSGQSIVMAFGSRGSASANNCSTVTGVTGAAGSDVFTNVTTGGSIVNSTAFTGCVSVWKMWAPTANASYAIVIQGGGTSPATMTIGALLFTPGSVVGTNDAPCSNYSNGATSASCVGGTAGTGTIVTTGSTEVTFAAIGQYDNISGTTPYDNSTPAFTLPTNSPVSSINGGLIFSYYVGTGTLTPAFQHVGAGDPWALFAMSFK